MKNDKELSEKEKIAHIRKINRSIYDGTEGHSLKECPFFSPRIFCPDNHSENFCDCSSSV